MNKSNIVFFKNYDLVDSENGPGESFYYNMHKYKSVSDFLKKRKKRNKKKKLLSFVKNIILKKAKDENNLAGPESEETSFIPYVAPSGSSSVGLVDNISSDPDFDLTPEENIYYGINSMHQGYAGSE